MQLIRTGGSRRASRVASRLSAYIPRALALRLLRGEQLNLGEKRDLQAATLFCDVSGFSTMASQLAADGPRGAEELNRVLLLLFTAMINAIHSSGGIVSHFHGDAMLVYFPDDDGLAAHRALACGQFMQSIMQNGYSQVQVSLADGTPISFGLSMKIGIGYGSLIEICVGRPERGLEFVVAGEGIDEAVRAEQASTPDQLLATQPVLRKAGLPFDPHQPFNPVTTMLPVPFADTQIHWEAYDLELLWQLSETAAAFVPPVLLERIIAESGYFVAEHRPVTSLFLRFEGIDYAAPDAGEKLQLTYEWATGIVERFGRDNSRVNRLLIGDKGSVLHIIFGAPVAPSAPVDALRCALALQDDPPPFIREQRIGVAAGNAFACAVGSRSRREYTIVGEIVNLSARLTDHCPAGGIMVNSQLARRVGERLQCERQPAIQIKEYTEPLDVYLVTGERERSGARNRMTPIERPFNGRFEEQLTLLNRTDRALAGEGGLAVLCDAANAESSYLLATSVNRWRDVGGQTLIGLAQEHLGKVQLSLWRNVWRDLFNLMPEMDEDEQIEQVITQVTTLAPAHIGDLSLLSPVLALAMPVTGKAMIGLSPEERQQRIFDLMATCLIESARKQPLLLVLDNIQQADPHSFAFLRELSRRWADVPLLVIATLEGDAQAAQELLLPDGLVVQLHDLTPEQGRQMVRRLLGSSFIPEPLFKHLGLTSHENLINPLLLEESLNMLLEMGVLTLENGIHIDETALDEMGFPDSVHGLLLARFDRLSTAARTVLQAASVLGRQFDRKALLPLLPDFAPAQVKPVLKELATAHMIQPVNVLPEPYFLFHNHQLRQVAYRSIPYGRRQRWHATHADWLLTTHRDNLNGIHPLLAYHYSQTDLKEKAFSFALAAANDAADMLFTENALKFYAQAESQLRELRIREEPKYVRLGLLIQQRRAEMQRVAGNFKAARREAQRLIAAAERQAHSHFQARGELILGHIALLHGSPQAALRHAQAVETLLAAQPAHEAELGLAYLLTGWAQAYLGEFSAAQRGFTRAVKQLRRQPHKRGLMWAHLLWGLELSVWLDDWSVARGHFEAAQSLLDAQQTTSPEERLVLMLGLARLALMAGKIDLAEEHLLVAERLFDEREFDWWRPLYFWLQAQLWRQQDAADLTSVMLEAGLSAVGMGGDPGLRPLLLMEQAAQTSDPLLRTTLLEQALRAADEQAPYLVRRRCQELARSLDTTRV